MNYNEKDVVRIISLTQALSHGKTLQTPNGNGGWVDVKDPIVNDLLLYFNNYRIKSDDTVSKYNIELSDEEIDVVKTAIDGMLLAKVNGKAEKLCRNILNNIDKLNYKEVEVPMFETCPDVLCDDCTKECEMKKIMKKAETFTEEELEKELENQKEETHMIQNADNVITEGTVTTTSICYDDVLRTNIKAVLHSDMKEDDKVNVIIGLCTQHEIMKTSTYCPTYRPQYPWDSQIMYTSQNGKTE